MPELKFFQMGNRVYVPVDQVREAVEAELREFGIAPAKAREMGNRVVLRILPPQSAGVHKLS